ncbi:MAG: hypothetical protein CMI53_04105 [Parcubacteria group bacterium]|jgi:hypothetical protein|nr:hypothetical protein [Parcubacteria group bacterium]|tara:strand:+ start:765 stop:1004 length:240 start_codon:yes stop_codon:yes gene_type:complete
MGIPISIFYFIYLIFVLIFLAFTFFNVYHLVRFGFLTIGNIVIVCFYIAISFLILVISWGYIGQIDWTATIPIIPTLNF